LGVAAVLLALIFKGSQTENYYWPEFARKHFDVKLLGKPAFE